MLFFRLIMLLISGVIVGIGIVLLYGGREEMISFLIAYISSAVVLLISFRNYKRVVQRGVEAKSMVVDNRDSIERIDDPFDLYSKENREFESEASLREIIKAQKRALKRGRGSLKERVESTLYAFSPLRLFSYFLLIFGFLYLLKHKSLVLSYYLSALIIPVILVIFYLFIVGAQIEIEEEN